MLGSWARGPASIRSEATGGGQGSGECGRGGGWCGGEGGHELERDWGPFKVIHLRGAWGHGEEGVCGWWQPWHGAGVEGMGAMGP